MEQLRTKTEGRKGFSKLYTLAVKAIRVSPFFLIGATWKQAAFVPRESDN